MEQQRPSSLPSSPPMLRRNSSFMRGCGPPGEPFSTARRHLPSDGKHLMASFSRSVSAKAALDATASKVPVSVGTAQGHIFVYITCSAAVAKAVRAILCEKQKANIDKADKTAKCAKTKQKQKPWQKRRDRKHIVHVDEDAVDPVVTCFGPYGTRVNVHLDFLNAAYAGTWSDLVHQQHTVNDDNNDNGDGEHQQGMVSPQPSSPSPEGQRSGKAHGGKHSDKSNVHALEEAQKPAGALVTLTLRVHTAFFDLLLGKAVRTEALPSVTSQGRGVFGRGDFYWTKKAESLDPDHCALRWEPLRRLDGGVLSGGPRLLGLVVAGGWLRRLLTPGDGLALLLPEQDMRTFLVNQVSLLGDTLRGKLVRVPKQRHYDPGPRPRPVRLAELRGFGGVKWTKPHWVSMSAVAARARSSTALQNGAEVDGKDGVSAWGDNGRRSDPNSPETSQSQQPPPLHDMCFLLDRHFKKDRRRVLMRALDAGVGTIVLLPGSLADCETAWRHYGAGKNRQKEYLEKSEERTGGKHGTGENSAAGGEQGKERKECEAGRQRRIEATKPSPPPGKLLGLSVDPFRTPGKSDREAPNSGDAPTRPQKQGVTLKLSVGVHPDDADTWSTQVRDRLLNMLEEQELLPRDSNAGAARIEAVGVCGLDFHRMLASAESQMDAFLGQLYLARTRELPAIVMEQWASEEMIRILSDPLMAPSRVVLVGFDGSREQARDYLDAHDGLFIALNGALCHAQRGCYLRGMLRNNDIPLERLVVYTGAPYGHPGNTRNRPWKRCEPHNLSRILKTVAKACQVPLALVQEVMAENHAYLFGARAPPDGRLNN